MNCSKCGTPIPDTDQFCPNCGAPKQAGGAAPRGGGVAKTVFGMPGLEGQMPMPPAPGGAPGFPQQPGGAPPGGMPGGDFGVPPPGAPPVGGVQGGYGAPMGGYGGPPQSDPSGGYGAPPQPGPSGGYGAPPPGGQAPGGYGAPPPADFSGGYGAPPGGQAPDGYGAPPSFGGMGSSPGAGYGAPPVADPGSGPGGGYGAYPAGGGSAPGGFGAPPAGGMGGFGAPNGAAPPPGGMAPGGGFGGAPPPVGAPPAGAKKSSCGKIILIVVIIMLALGLIGGITTAVVCYMCVDAVTSTLIPGLTQTFTLGPDSPTIEEGSNQGNPYKDFSFTPDQAGAYTLDLRAEGADSFLIVLLDGTEVGTDDDGGEGLNSRYVLNAEAGVEYTIRASSLAPLESDVSFSVSCSFGAAPSAPTETPPAGTPPAETPPVGTPPVGTPPVGTPPVGTPPAVGGSASGCDGLAACCGANPPVPNAAVTCGQVETWRGLPGGAGEGACTTALNGLRAAMQATGATVPAQCQ